MTLFVPQLPSFSYSSQEGSEGLDDGPHTGHSAEKQEITVFKWNTSFNCELKIEDETQTIVEKGPFFFIITPKLALRVCSHVRFQWWAQTGFCIGESKTTRLNHDYFFISSISYEIGNSLVKPGLEGKRPKLFAGIGVFRGSGPGRERGVAAPNTNPRGTWLSFYPAGSAATQVMGLQGILSRPVLLALRLAEHRTRKPRHGSNNSLHFFW